VTDIEEKIRTLEKGDPEIGEYLDSLRSKLYSAERLASHWKQCCERLSLSVRYLYQGGRDKKPKETALLVGSSLEEYSDLLNKNPETL